MTAKDSSNSGHSGKPSQQAGTGKTIDLQGVASFVGLVELIAQELGTAPGRIQGHLPSGPATFEELFGEIVINSQGFHRTLTLWTKPGSPLKLKFTCAWRDGSKVGPDGVTVGGVEAHFFLDATVEQIAPQGRALARYVEDCFKLLDSMVTLGQSGKLSSMAISTADIEAFELSQSGNLVSTSLPKRSESFDP